MRKQGAGCGVKLGGLMVALAIGVPSLWGLVGQAQAPLRAVARLIAPAVDAAPAGAQSDPHGDASSRPLRESPQFLKILETIPGGDVQPCSVLQDPYPSFNGVAIDPKARLAILTDPNLRSAMIYDLDVAATPQAKGITPRRAWVRGPATWLSFATGVAVDSVRHRFYVTENDWGDDLANFPYAANGDYKAQVLAIPHGTYGIGISQHYGQIALAIEHSIQIAFFKIGAQAADPPLRSIRGPHTGLADPHGLFWDEKNGEIVVANYGNWSQGQWDPDYPGGGHYFPPSITVYKDDGKGDVTPLRVIQGSKTRLNWPTGVAVDTRHNELLVTNQTANQVLVFARTASGNVAPLRILGGPRTLIRHPMGVAYDPIRDQIWVANYGHTAEVFARVAAGDASPLRVIRNAPAGTPEAGFGGPSAIAYDSRRDQILATN